MLMIELYINYEEIFFIDAFYIWNNTKNGKIWSWFDKSKNPYIMIKSDV